MRRAEPVDPRRSMPASANQFSDAKADAWEREQRAKVRKHQSRPVTAREAEGTDIFGRHQPLRVPY